MISTSFQSVVLVHGAYHQPLHYKLLITALESIGFRVSAPHLPSTQHIPAIQSLNPDIDAVRAAVLSELDHSTDPRDVIMVLHSYGGLPGTQALEGLVKDVREQEGEKTGVVAAVMIACNIVEEGESGMSYLLVSEELTRTMIERATKDNDGYLRVNPEEARQMWYNKQPPAVADEAIKHLSPWAFAVSTSPSAYAGHKDVPVTYKWPTDDVSMLPEIFERSSSKTGKGGRPFKVIRCVGDHSPFLDKPDWLAQVIKNGAGVEDELMRGIV